MFYLETLIQPINFTWAGINASHRVQVVNVENPRYSPRMFLENRFLASLTKMITENFMETFLSTLTLGAWANVAYVTVQNAIRVDVIVLAPKATLEPSGDKNVVWFVKGECELNNYRLC
jgi:hypothetical protein